MLKFFLRARARVEHVERERATAASRKSKTLAVNSFVSRGQRFPHNESKYMKRITFCTKDTEKRKKKYKKIKLLKKCFLLFKNVNCQLMRAIEGSDQIRVVEQSTTAILEHNELTWCCNVKRFVDASGGHK